MENLIKICCCKLPESIKEQKLHTLYSKKFLRLVLQRTMQIEVREEDIVYGKYKKPSLRRYPDIHYNISHSGRYMLCAVAKVPVGLDIEFCRERSQEKLARKILNNEEYEIYLNASDRQKCFFRYWVLKESYLKWTGEGITRDLDKLDMTQWWKFLEIDQDYECCFYSEKETQVEVIEIPYGELEATDEKGGTYMNDEYVTFTIGKQKKIALIAHDGKKQEMIQWCEDHKDILKNHFLCGTGTTARMITDRTGLPVKGYNSGPLGGDQQIGAKIVEGNIDFVVFFSDPLEAQPHDPDVKALLRIAQVYDIPMANNKATADFMITSKYMNDEYDHQVINFKNNIAKRASTL